MKRKIERALVTLKEKYEILKSDFFKSHINPILKCCPFCGGNASWNGTSDTEWVKCDHCDITTGVYDIGSGEAEEHWNKRF